MQKLKSDLRISAVRVLAVILDGIQRNGYSPSYREIAERMSWGRGLNYVQECLEILKKHGLIDHDPTLARTIRPKCRMILVKEEQP